MQGSPISQPCLAYGWHSSRASGRGWRCPRCASQRRADTPAAAISGKQAWVSGAVPLPPICRPRLLPSPGCHAPCRLVLFKYLIQLNIKRLPSPSYNRIDSGLRLSFCSASSTSEGPAGVGERAGGGAALAPKAWPWPRASDPRWRLGGRQPGRSPPRAPGEAGRPDTQRTIVYTQSKPLS